MWEGASATNLPEKRCQDLRFFFSIFTVKNRLPKSNISNLLSLIFWSFYLFWCNLWCLYKKLKKVRAEKSRPQ